MLRSVRKPVFIQDQPTHVDVFVEHYDLLKRTALRFTEQDKHLAEDLLHDTFIHFTISKPDLDAIENIEGYLYIVMRNLHLSQMRRATRSPLRYFSAIEYDTADMSFWASDPRDRLKIRDELNAVCQFACARKEGSKSGSLLILRFVHGYYPDEIALIMRGTRAAVNAGLKKVRAETRLFIDHPERLGFILEKLPSPASANASELTGDDFCLDLRRRIFESRNGECLPEDLLKNKYQPENDGPDRQALAHIVSCQTCIENANSLLGLAPLAGRYPLDTIGKDPGSKGGPDDGGSGGAGGGQNMLDTYLRRRDAHFHHEPKELCISVNGQFHSLQRIVSGKGELMLQLDTSESLGFVEVFSELGLRLLMLNVEPPPNGDGKQHARVELSGGRTIDANLNFGGAFPALQVTYNDPEPLPETAADIEPELIETPKPQPLPIPAERPASNLKLLLDALRSMMQPARITAAFAVLLAAAALTLYFIPTGSVSAAELLQRSAEIEDAKLANRDRVFHRTLDLEERNAGGQVTARKRIDVWHSADRGVTARRLYDERGALEMGDWRRSDGIQTLYKRGEAAKLQPLPEKRNAQIAFDDAWQMSVTAKEFMAMFEGFGDAQLETRANDYLISYTPPSNTNEGITNAAIVLSKEDYHAIEQQLTLRGPNAEVREYRFVETSYEWKPANVVAPAVFEPNVEFTGVHTVLAAPTNAPAANTDAANTNSTSNTNSNTGSAPANIATASLEVEVVEALNKAGAFMGEQIDVSRTPDGKISVSGLVETAERKRELLSALEPVRANPAVRITIETVAELQARQKNSGAATPVQTGTPEQVTLDDEVSPVYAELKKKFSDDEAKRFADRVVSRARQTRAHALAMKQIAERFSAADLESLTVAERGRWLGLIRGHAESFVREGESLRRELQQIFPEAAGSSPSGGEIGSDKEIQAKVRDLFEVSGTIQAGLGRSFALNAGRSGTPPVKTEQFWQSYLNALALAKSLQAVR